MGGLFVVTAIEATHKTRWLQTHPDARRHAVGIPRRQGGRIPVEPRPHIIDSSGPDRIEQLLHALILDPRYDPGTTASIRMIASSTVSATSTKNPRSTLSAVSVAL